MVVVVVVVEGVVLGDVGVGEARVAALVGKNNACVADGLGVVAGLQLLFCPLPTPFIPLPTLF